MSSAAVKPRAVTFTPARAEDQARGLLGFVTCRLGNLVLDGIAVRRTLAGKATLSFPARRDRGGAQHPYVRPDGDQARREFEAEVFRAIGLQEGGRD